MTRLRVVTAVAMAVMLACTKQPTPQATFEPLYRATRALEGSVMVGVNYADMGQELQRLAAEVLIAKDRAASPEERAMVEAYSEVLLMYKDSLTVWKTRSSRQSTSGCRGESP